MDEILLRECIEYFKGNKGFKRAFEKIRDKYKSLGTLGGTIVLNNLTESEKDALSGFFRRDYYKKSTSIKVEKFIRALDDTKFSTLEFEVILENYFGEKLTSKKEERNIYEEEKDIYFREIIDSISGERGLNWFSGILNNKENAYRIINQKYDENKEILKINLMSVFKALDIISFEKSKTMRLALLASTVTRDPHWFDYDKDPGKLFIFAIEHFLKVPCHQNAEELAENLYSAGIIKDEVSNYTVCSGVLAYDRCGKAHEGWKGFYHNGEPLQVSLWNISKIHRINSLTGKVFVFENPTVFSEILYRTSNLKPALVCTFGNFKLASLILLDKLAESGAVIYYSGDFDPEGIIMADKLKQRYKDKLILWRYGKEDYFSIISKVPLTPLRLNKLNKLKSEELMDICEIIKQYNCAGYQEMLIDEYERDIKLIVSQH